MGLIPKQLMRSGVYHIDRDVQEMHPMKALCTKINTTNKSKDIDFNEASVSFVAGRYIYEGFLRLKHDYGEVLNSLEVLCILTYNPTEKRGAGSQHSIIVETFKGTYSQYLQYKEYNCARLLRAVFIPACKVYTLRLNQLPENIQEILKKPKRINKSTLETLGLEWKEDSFQFAW